jgi:hypothetical protein
MAKRAQLGLEQMPLPGQSAGARDQDERHSQTSGSAGYSALTFTLPEGVTA